MNREAEVLKNKKLTMTLRSDRGIYLSEFGHRDGGAPQQFTPETGSLFRFYDAGCEYPAEAFTVTREDPCRDATENMVSANARLADLRLRVNILADRERTIRIILQAASDAPYPRPLSVSCPFLSHLEPPGSEGGRRYPGNPVCLPDGSPVLLLHPLFPMPYVLINKSDTLGYSVSFPTLSNLEAAVQNRNVDLRHIANAQELADHRLPLRLGRTLTDIFELEIYALKAGWMETFDRCRSKFRETLDMQQYKRPDLDWMKTLFLHHFTYLYGKESFDYDTERPDINKVLDEGKEFGGYDSVTLWHQYPRLGVDRRSQWDFFEDFPGGLTGLRETVDAVHNQKVRVFLPYKPWDVGPGESMNNICEKLSHLITKSGVDGLFLDTMTTIPAEFRRTMDAVHPGLVFISEGYPESHRALEVLTGSWEQYFRRGSGLEVNCLRFAVPEHNFPVINRWALGEEKDQMLLRAMFSGSGLVIWQDVFGTWLPFTPEQKERIFRYKEIWLRDQDIFMGGGAIPLLPTGHESLFCNMFASDTRRAFIFTLYNHSGAKTEGNLLLHPLDARYFPGDKQNHGDKKPVLSVLLGDGTIAITEKYLTGELKPKEFAMIKITWED